MLGESNLEFGGELCGTIKGWESGTVCWCCCVLKGETTESRISVLLDPEGGETSCAYSCPTEDDLLSGLVATLNVA